MQFIAKTLRFGWPYLMRYRSRFLLGVFLGMLFGLSNASFVWASKTLFERLTPEAQKAATPNASVTRVNLGSPTATIRETASKAADFSRQILDPWLPKIGRPADWRQILGGFLLLPVLVGTRSFLGFGSSYCMNWVSHRITYDLRYDVLAKLYTLSLDYFHKGTMGDHITRVNTDTGVLHKTLTSGLSDIVKEPFTILGILIALCLVSTKLTLIAVIFLPVCVIPLIILGKKVRRAMKASWSASIDQSSIMVEAISGIRIVKAYNLEKDSLLRFKGLCRELVHHNVKASKAQELINPVVEIVSMLGLGMLIVVIFSTSTSLPDLAGFLMGVVLLFSPIKKLAGVHVLFQRASVGVDRLVEIMEEQATVREPIAAKPFTRFEKGIEIDHLSFAYKEEPVLRDLSLNIAKGEKLGVAGESGSGKSTLVNLLFRFYDPTHGALRIDGTDVREFSTTDLREHMAFVSQEVVLFDKTVAENIACGRPGATRDEVEEAGRAAYAHDFINRLPQGYDTRIGEQGVTLSGGQRQRIAIARAFVRNAPILALDEATASLDSQAEAEVQKAIEKLEENRTVICIAHRLSTLKNMDRIIVLTEGEIRESGSFKELLAQKGSFAAMAARQGIYD